MRTFLVAGLLAGLLFAFALGGAFCIKDAIACARANIAHDAYARAWAASGGD